MQLSTTGGDMVDNGDNVEALRPIVVGIDGSHSSKVALEWAVCQAKLTHEPLAIITTWQHPKSYNWTQLSPQETDFAPIAQCLLDDSVNAVLADNPDLYVTALVVQGHPAVTLVEHSRGASLVVVGSRGHGEFIGMLLGSVSAFLAAHAHCPVVIVRGEGAAHD